MIIDRLSLGAAALRSEGFDKCPDFNAGFADADRALSIQFGQGGFKTLSSLNLMAPDEVTYRAWTDGLEQYTRDFAPDAYAAHAELKRWLERGFGSVTAGKGGDDLAGFGEAAPPRVTVKEFRAWLQKANMKRTLTWKRAPRLGLGLGLGAGSFLESVSLGDTRALVAAACATKATELPSLLSSRTPMPWGRVVREDKQTKSNSPPLTVIGGVGVARYDARGQEPVQQRGQGQGGHHQQGRPLRPVRGILGRARVLACTRPAYFPHVCSTQTVRALTRHRRVTTRVTTRATTRACKVPRARRRHAKKKSGGRTKRVSVRVTFLTIVIVVNPSTRTPHGAYVRVGGWVNVIELTAAQRLSNGLSCLDPVVTSSFTKYASDSTKTRMTPKSMVAFFKKEQGETLTTAQAQSIIARYHRGM